MALKNRDYEQAIKNGGGSSSNELGNSTDDTHIKAGSGKDTIIENDAGQPTAVFKDNLNTELKGALTTEGGATIKGNADLKQGLTVAGDTTLKDATVEGLTITGDTIVGDGASDTLEVKATPIFRENTQFKKDLAVDGDLTVTGTFNPSSISTTGNTTLGDSATDSLTVNATPTFEEDTTFKKSVDVQGDTTLEKTDIDGVLTATKSVSLGGSATDTLTVISTPTFKENVTMEKDLSVAGNTTIGNTASDTHTIKGDATFMNNSIVKENFAVDGDTTIGVDNTTTLTVKATPTFKESSKFEKDILCEGNTKVEGQLQIGTDGTNDYIAYQGSPAQFQFFVDGVNHGHISKTTTNPDNIDKDRIVVGIESYYKNYSPLDATYIQTLNIAGDTGGHFANMDVFHEVQGRHCMMSFGCVVTGLSITVPTDTATTIEIKMDEVWGDTDTPNITGHKNGWGVGEIAFTDGTKRSCRLACRITISNNILKIEGGDIIAGAGGNFTADRVDLVGAINYRYEL